MRRLPYYESPPQAWDLERLDFHLSRGKHLRVVSFEGRRQRYCDRSPALVSKDAPIGGATLDVPRELHRGGVESVLEDDGLPFPLRTHGRDGDVLAERFPAS